MPDNEWYYARQGQQQGPVSAQALQSLLNQRQVDWQDLVWTPGMDRWEPASSVNVFTPPPPTAPVLPPVPSGQGYVQGQAFVPPWQGASGAGYGTGSAPGPTPGYQGTPHPLQYAPGSTPYADWGTRILAGLIDLVVMAVLFRVIGYPRHEMAVALPWLYHALMESSAGSATLGMRALGIRVTTLEGERISFTRASCRFFASYLSALILCIGYLMIAFTERRQALHDIIAGCVVTRTNPGQNV